MDLTKGSIWLLLRKVTIPASTGSLFQTFYNLVDTYFAGKISPEALAAIAKSWPIYFIAINCFCNRYFNFCNNIWFKFF